MYDCLPNGAVYIKHDVLPLFGFRSRREAHEVPVRDEITQFVRCLRKKRGKELRASGEYKGYEDLKKYPRYKVISHLLDFHSIDPSDYDFMLFWDIDPVSIGEMYAAEASKTVWGEVEFEGLGNEIYKVRGE